MASLTKICISIITGLLALITTIGGWWANRVQVALDTHTQAIVELQTEAKFFHGNSARIKTDLQPEQSK